MKTKTLILSTLIICLSVNNLKAQKLSNPFVQADKYTSFGAMASVPVGKFSSTDLKDGGFAGTGWGVYFDSKTALKNGLYFVSHSTYSWVPLNHSALNTAFSSELNRKTTITGGKHMPFLTTLGFGYDIRPNKSISFGVYAQGGLMYNSFKAFDITVYNTDNTTVLLNDNVKYDSQFSFAYVFGAQASFNLVKDLIDFQVFADYSASNFTSTLRGHILQPIKTQQQIQIVNAGAGFLVHTK